MTWEDITLAQFRKIDVILNDSNYDDMDIVLHVACILYGHTEAEMNALPLRRVRKYIKKIRGLISQPYEPVAVSQIGPYTVSYDIANWRLGQYIEQMYWFSQRDSLAQHHFIIASAVDRGKNITHEQVRTYMLGAPITQTGGVVKRVEMALQQFNSSYPGLFDLDGDTDGSAAVHPFNKRYGWLYSATCVADHERITLEQAYDIPVRQAMNDLSYLKSKNAYQNEQLDKIRKGYGTKHK